MGVYYVQKSTQDWNINSTYTRGTIVKYNDKLYYAIKDVIRGINIGYSEYWTEVADMEDVESILEEIDNLKDDVIEIDNILEDTASVSDMADAIDDIETQYDEIEDNLTADVGGTKVAFEFTYDSTSEKYGYLDASGTFHAFNS